MRGLAAVVLAVALGCSEAAESPAAAAAAGERLVVDVREPADFAAGHDPGALNLQWGWAQLEARAAAYLPDHAAPLAIRADGERAAARAHAELLDQGYADVVVLSDEPGDEPLDVLTATELAARLDAGDDLVVIDVRTPAEWARGVIAGAIRVEQDAAPALVDELDPSGEYAVICAGGYRSSQLASLMRRRGFPRVSNVIDGMSAWYALGR